MITNIFVNLPVKDLDASKAFFTHLGFTFNAQFTDATAAALVIGSNMYAMLLTHAKWEELVKGGVGSSANGGHQVAVALGAEGREEVNRIADAAVASGGTEPLPASDLGFMFLRAFNDLDGHRWEVFWMDPAHVHQA